jgi:hypothetical protein
VTVTETLAPAPRAATPVPAGRGRWRLTLHQRQFAGPAAPLIAELVDARGRRLDQTLNTSAALTFTLDGASPEAALVQELATDVMAWRWDEASGADQAMFRGLVTHSEDQLSEDTNVVTFTCHDYLAMLDRRLMLPTGATPITYTATDQDTLVSYILVWGRSATSGASLYPGAFLPIYQQQYNPDGTLRAASGVLRTRTYMSGTVAGVALNELALVAGGFDYDMLPWPRTAPPTTLDYLRIFYPQQGVTRTDCPLIYGTTVSALTRQVNGPDYTNLVHMIGNNATADPNAAQLYAEVWNSDANNVTVNPVGTWETAQNAADVTLNGTLTEQANGILNRQGLLVPSYTVTMRPGAYTFGAPNLGDTVPLVVIAGRLNVNTTVRVLGISYAPSDDGDEAVTLTVGKTAIPSLAGMLAANARDIRALTRR